MALIVLSGKVTPEVQEQFKAAQENSEALTFNAFMELLLEAFLNPKVKSIDVPRPTAEQLQELQLKDNEIGRLKTQIDFLNEDIHNYETARADLAAAVLELEKRSPEALTIGEGQELLTIPPIVALVLDREAATALKKSGKTFSRGDILLNSFWESITNGAAHPFRVWSSSELSALKKQLQAAQV